MSLISTLIEIQTHEKNAKKLVRKTESSARQVEKQIPRPLLLVINVVPVCFDFRR
jgi:hypothetical protein